MPHLFRRATSIVDHVLSQFRDGPHTNQRGFFGASAASEDERIDLQPALAAAAAIALDLIDDRGDLIPATFVDILEPPDQSTPVVIARLRDAHARVAAKTPPREGRDGEASRPAA